MNTAVVRSQGVIHVFSTKSRLYENIAFINSHKHLHVQQVFCDPAISITGGQNVVS